MANSLLRAGCCCAHDCDHCTGDTPYQWQVTVSGIVPCACFLGDSGYASFAGDSYSIPASFRVSQSRYPGMSCVWGKGLSDSYLKYCKRDHELRGTPYCDDCSMHTAQPLTASLSLGTLYVPAKLLIQGNIGDSVLLLFEASLSAMVPRDCAQAFQVQDNGSCYASGPYVKAFKDGVATLTPLI